MKSRILFSSILVAGFMLVSSSLYQVNGQTTQDKPVKQQTVKYTCPAHPEVVQNMPGKCPKCGMTLVEKKDMAQGNMQHVDDSTMMKHDHMKMMNDTTMMKHDHMKMMHDSTMMRRDHMMHDTMMMKKGHMMQDTTSMKHEKMGM